MRNAAAVPAIHAYFYFVRYGEDEREGADDYDDDVMDIAQHEDVGDDGEAAPKDGDEGETVSGHDGSEEEVCLVGIQARGADAEEGEADGGGGEHEEDGPAEVGDGGAFEGVEDGEEEDGSDDDAAEEGDDIDGLDEDGAEDGAEEAAVEEVRWSLAAEGHVFDVAADAVVEVEEGGAEGSSGDAVVAEHDEDGGDEECGEHGDADDAARAEGDSGEDDVAEGDPDGKEVSHGEESEEDASDESGDEGDAAFAGVLYGAVCEVDGGGEEEEHEHLGESAE